VTELSAYTLSPLREGPFTLSRGLGDGLSPSLLVAPAGEYPSPTSLRWLEHEYALRSDLDGDWAARPVELLRGLGGAAPLEGAIAVSGRPVRLRSGRRLAGRIGLHAA
jgi:hypothetical protein